MRLKVIREKGDVLKPEVVVLNLVKGNVAVALQRGRVEMDLGENWNTVEQQTVFAPNAFVGNVAKSFDRLNGSAWFGVVTSVTHGLDSDGNLVTQQNLLRKPL